MYIPIISTATYGLWAVLVLFLVFSCMIYPQNIRGCCRFLHFGICS
jgi:hypothetical protein